MTEDAAVQLMLNDYYAAFSTLHVQAILPYFHQPALLIGPQGVIPLPIPAAVEPIFTPVMQSLQTRGYRRSELNLREIRLLSAQSAFATGIAIRFKSHGEELERVGVTYLLRKSEGGAWKFAVMVLHDVPEASGA
jgi:ketosteroid isomerase-like protein